MIEDLGLLTARSVLGLGLAAHGAQKAFGWFGGPGLEGAAGFMESLGFRPGPLFARMAAYNEVVGGTLTALGLLNPLGPALILSGMLTAARSAHWGKGFFHETGGFERPALYAAGALALASAGPGRFSLDALLFERAGRPCPALYVAAIAAGLAGSLGSLVYRELQTSGGGASPPAADGGTGEGI